MTGNEKTTYLDSLRNDTVRIPSCAEPIELMCALLDDWFDTRNLGVQSKRRIASEIVKTFEAIAAKKCEKDEAA